jgi:hypothetical protein
MSEKASYYVESRPIVSEGELLWRNSAYYERKG